MGVPALQLTLFVVVGRTRTFPTKEATLSADMAFHIVWYCNLSDLQWYGNKDYMILRYFWSSVIVEKGHTQRASCLPVWLWMSHAFLFCEWDLTHCVDRWRIRWFGTITRTMELFIKMRQKKKKKKKRPKLVLWASLHDNVPTVDDKSLEHSLGKVDSLNWSVPLGSHWNSYQFSSHVLSICLLEQDCLQRRSLAHSVWVETLKTRFNRNRTLEEQMTSPWTWSRPPRQSPSQCPHLIGQPVSHHLNVHTQ